ncbi:TIGR03943 family putative permease subunit [Streptomyces sp. URMC 123]|uniref:TIGR03943 family putative permease subunit n=1 Tax=Streptomyces sp. URMC 123 TaxID=3423403 RepID=UPI003F1E170F
MKRTAQTALLLLTGAALLHVSLFGEFYLRYVKEGFRPLLIASGCLLTLAGLVAAGRDGFPFPKRHPEPHPKQPTEPHPEGQEAPDRRAPCGHGGHGPHAGPRIAWLLFLPALTLLFAPPAPLGSFTAARDTGASPAAATAPDSGAGTDAAGGPRPAFDPLPAASPVPLSLSEFTRRAQQDPARDLRDRTVTLSGFVTPGTDGTWYLTRLVISCCAADSRAVKVAVHGAPAPPADSWVAVTGRWHPRGILGTASAAAALDAAHVRPAAPPPNPYSDTPPPAG